MELTNNIATLENKNRVGIFTPADIVGSFDADFLAEDSCRTWIMKKLYQDQELCPGCGIKIPENLLQNFWENKRIRCDRCGKYFTALTDTFLSGCHFDFREIVLLAFLLALGIEDKRIAATLKVSDESVRLWRLKFKALEIKNDK
jgi:transposase-like protein